MNQSPNIQIYLFENAKWNYWIIQEFASELYLIKLDFITTLKIGIANEVPMFLNIYKKINSFDLLDFQSKYDIVVNITNSRYIKLEKGNLMQNKLVIENDMTTYNLYLVNRGQTKAAENILHKYFSSQIEITDNGHF